MHFLPLLLLGEEPKKTSFAVLSGFTWSIGVTLPKEVQLLDDVTVDISGFMMREIPGSGPVNTFLLINDALEHFLANRTVVHVLS